MLFLMLRRLRLQLDVGTEFLEDRPNQAADDDHREDHCDFRAETVEFDLVECPVDELDDGQLAEEDHKKCSHNRQRFGATFVEMVVNAVLGFAENHQENLEEYCREDRNPESPDMDALDEFGKEIQYDDIDQYIGDPGDEPGLGIGDRGDPKLPIWIDWSV